MGLSDRADEALIYVSKVQKRKRREAHFKSQDRRVLLNRHEVTMLEYVRENEDLKEKGAAYAAQT